MTKSKFISVCSGIVLLAIGIFFLNEDSASALDPGEILVIANSRMSGSEDLARYYMKKRKIPDDRLLSVSVSTNEAISREEYQKAVLFPVREAVKTLRKTGKVHCLVLFYGMPLKIMPPPSTPQLSETAAESQHASVDSEIALALVDSYPLEGWVQNPYFLGFQNKKTLVGKDEVLMVGRLDGPDAKTVYRIIDDTLAAEKKGLQGIGYFNARWPLPQDKNLSGYALYDAAIHRAEQLVKARMPTVLKEGSLFGPGECDHAALYCGWYSLGHYIDSFTWSLGAIGYHIASSECTTLKDTSSQVWCLNMLERGAVATIGPVYEPYVQGFPLPDIFFGSLVDGYLSLGECYLIALPYLSWQMVLVGDPLYQPFRPLSPRPGLTGRSKS
ncbi:MAG: TIGR03790 family protein [Desulfocapsaceae bacterium]|nr:TIGR03790 family protein [Desulfocapsaceae bacterium]